jgi:hypothetical protein
VNNRKLVAVVSLIAIFNFCAGEQRPIDDSPIKPRTDSVETGAPGNSKAIRLFENKLGGYRSVSKISEPKRVYLKKSVLSRDLEYYLTGENGKLSDPEEYLLPGTVVRGDRIGDSKERYFLLTLVEAKKKPGDKSTEKKFIKGWRRTTGPAVYLTQTDRKDGSRWIVTFEDEEAKPRRRIDDSPVSGDFKEHTKLE